MKSEETPGSRTVRLTSSIAATLPAFGVVALGLWRYLFLVVLIGGVSLFGWTTRQMWFLGAYLVFAAAAGAVVNVLGFDSQMIMVAALPVWLGGFVLVIWLDKLYVQSD